MIFGDGWKQLISQKRTAWRTTSLRQCVDCSKFTMQTTITVSGRVWCKANGYQMETLKNRGKVFMDPPLPKESFSRSNGVIVWSATLFVNIQMSSEGYLKPTRYWGPNQNLASNESLWTVSMPHPANSGLCFTYKWVFLPFLLVSFCCFKPKPKITSWGVLQPQIKHWIKGLQFQLGECAG